jgi:probable F420-dependent oxidoreductase
MKFGLYDVNLGACARPQSAAAVARAAEDAGFDSLWAGEHVVRPDPQAPPSPLAPDCPILDPVAALCFLAAHTSRVRLATGIIIMPQRNPLVLAKELASLDVLSGGRLTFGIGIGYLKAEFDALGAPFDRKAERTEDFIAAMRAVWSQERPQYRGKFVSFAGVQARPRPLQLPCPPIVVGGNTRMACARAARLGGGWYGFALDAAGAAQCVGWLREECAHVGCPFGEIEVSVTPMADGNKRYLAPDADGRAAAQRFADAGVDRLILRPPLGANEAAVLKFVGDAARELVGKV